MDDKQLLAQFAAAALTGLSQGCSGVLGQEFSAYAKRPCNAVLVNRAMLLADDMLAEFKQHTEQKGNEND